MPAEIPKLVREHESAGRYIQVRSRSIFVRDEGEGPPVLMVHGVPTSSFLYRKMFPMLAGRGLRAVAFDFPGLGLSDKPKGEAYDWHALTRWMEDIVAALDLEPVHLVVHDIGGPIGFEWAIRHPGNVRTITIMNTMLDVGRFHRPFPMWLYVVPGLRQVAVKSQSPALFGPIMRARGVKHREAASRAMVESYLWLLQHNDGHQPFLDIMAGFDLSESHGRFLEEGLRDLGVPMQLVWGEHEIAIPKHQLQHIQRALPLERERFVDARHFLQEDQAAACSEAVADFALIHADEERAASARHA